MAQEPGISVNVRFDLDQIAAIDDYAASLQKLRRTRVTRSDVLRLALGHLPALDAEQGAKPASGATRARPVPDGCAHSKTHAGNGGIKICDSCGAIKGADGQWRAA